MSVTIPDLWPVKLIQTNAVSPASILREQGYKLAEKTRNYILGRIVSNFFNENKFSHQFDLSCDLLGFNTSLVTVAHEFSFYPADFIIHKNIFCHESRFGVADMSELETALRKYFSQTGLIDLINSLYAQCLDDDSAN